MKVTYYGHSSFLLETEKAKLLFDPFITPNNLAKDINIDAIQADFILVSHAHSDHTADLIAVAKSTGATVISIFEITSWLESHGISNGHPMNIGGAWNFDFGRVKMVYAAHSSSFPDGSYGGNPAGFILEVDGKTIYYAGDTSLTQDMKLIGELYNIDLAFLPIGDNFTMGVDDAIIATSFIKCTNIIGMHYDTFGYIKIDHEEAVRKFKEQEIQLRLLTIGEPTDLF